MNENLILCDLSNDSGQISVIIIVDLCWFPCSRLFSLKMDMNYGCDVSNRYTGYLDSSDHGNPMSSTTGKNKRKTKKKRKSRNQQTKVDKDISTTDLGDLENNGEDATAQQPLTTDNNDEYNVDNNNESEYRDTVTNSIDGLSSLPSFCDSPNQLDTSKETNENNENTIEHDGMIVGETKWSVICFEEEKSFISHNGVGHENFVNEPEMVFKDQRVYPTVYFYNSKFGNKNRRVVYNDYHERNRRHHQNNNETIEPVPEEKEKRRGNRNGRHRRKFTVNDKEKCDTSEIQSANDKQIDVHESVDGASQQTNESKKPEYTKNRYNKFKHGIPERTFSRRRPDFVRNV